ncbi:hypothetical protein BT69DRAFT_1324822 [Atractiella rhizophila]|nr:hypothetical protein BT69DRAFT_1324822 [Atractiella rhizophila]
MQSGFLISKSSKKQASKARSETNPKGEERSMNDLRFGSPAFISAAQETWKRHEHLKASIFLHPEQGPPSLQTALYLYPAAKETLSKYTLQPITPPPQGWPFEIAPKRGPSGRGLMVATRDIAVGEIIVEECPLIVAPRIISLVDLEALVALFPEENRKAWDTLPNCKGPEVPINAAIMRSNAVAKHFSDDDQMPYCEVFNRISRMEHSCCPNTYMRRFEDSLVNQVLAVRFIPKGASITNHNVDIMRPRTQRQSDLQRMWSLECHCEACDLKNIVEMKKSDQRRAFLSKKKLPLPAVVGLCREPDTISLANIDHLLKEIKYAELENLGFPDILVPKISLAILYAAMGQRDKAIEITKTLFPTMKLFDFLVPEPILRAMEESISAPPAFSPNRGTSQNPNFSDLERIASDPNAKVILFTQDGPKQHFIAEMMTKSEVSARPEISVTHVPLEDMVERLLNSMTPEERASFEQFSQNMHNDPAFRKDILDTMREEGALPEEMLEFMEKRHAGGNGKV